MTSIDVFASRAFRWVASLSSINGALLVALGLVRLFAEGGVGLLSALNTLGGLLALGYFGWVAYHAWRVPILHLDAAEIRWCPLGSRRPRRMPLAAVTGFRWPYPRDLWIESNEAGTFHITVGGISRHDRARIRTWLGERWRDGGLIA